MIATRIRLDSRDHGRRLSLSEFDDAEYSPGFHYEIIDGRLYVAPAPDLPENILESWLRNKVESYRHQRPDAVAYVAVRGRVFVSTKARSTVPEPDLALYPSFLATDYNTVKWQDMSPMIVIEILVGGDMAKDLSRNPKLYHRLKSIREYWVLNASQDANRPTLVVHRRRGKSWAVEIHPFNSTYTTDVLPGFELVIDPHQ